MGPLNHRRHGGVDAAPKVFRNSAKMRWPIWLKVDTALRLSFLHLPWNFKVRFRSGYGVMTSYMTSCSVEIGGFEIYRIWVSFIAFWSGLLHCKQHKWWSLTFRSHIQLPRGQGHARTRVSWAVSVAHLTVIFRTLQLFWASRTLFRAERMPDLESALMNWLNMTHHVSGSSKAIWSHLRSLISDDLECSNCLLGSTTGCFGVF